MNEPTVMTCAAEPGLATRSVSSTCEVNVGAAPEAPSWYCASQPSHAVDPVVATGVSVIVHVPTRGGLLALES